MSRHVIIAAAAAAYLLPLSARAEDSPLDELARMARAPAGSWALYRTTPSEKNSLIGVHTMRFFVARRTKTLMAVEMQVKAGKKAKALEIRSVFSRRRGKWVGARAYLREEDGSVSVQKADNSLLAAQLQPKGKLVGTEVVKTKAGTFRCKRYKRAKAFGEAELWISDEVHPMGMVKAVTPMVTTELVAHGKDAKPLFTAAELRRAKPLKKKKQHPKKTKR
jgi:hypothetical protein